MASSNDYFMLLLTRIEHFTKNTKTPLLINFAAVFSEIGVVGVTAGPGECRTASLCGNNVRETTSSLSIMLLLDNDGRLP
jgi:hypothetical protein